MTYIKMPKQPIDDKKSTLWAIAFLSSVAGGYRGMGGALVVLDLVNMETYRAHRMTWAGTGKKTGRIPIGGAVKDSAYSEFKTSRPANFSDFDGKAAKFKIKDRLVHSKRSMTIYDGSQELAEMSISGWGPSIPGGINGNGVTEIYYSDGRPVNTVNFRPYLKFPKADGPKRFTAVAMENAVAITLPDKVLFDFDRDWLHYQATYALRDVFNFIEDSKGFTNIEIEGHTDNKERVAGYNMDLSRRRAETVLNYFRQHGGELNLKYKIEAKWYGSTKPVAPNTLPNGADDPVGREKNRRVEIILSK